MKTVLENLPIPPWARFIAMNKAGDWWFHELRPGAHRDTWVSAGNFAKAFTDPTLCDDWYQSLYLIGGDPQHVASTAPALLNKAAKHMADRAATYDQPEGERSMGRAVDALNCILGREALRESEGWLLMQLLKDVRDRQRSTPHLDSLEDGIAYSALKAEARLKEAV